MPMLVGIHRAGRYLKTKLTGKEEISKVQEQNEPALCKGGPRTPRRWYNPLNVKFYTPNVMVKLQLDNNFKLL